MGNLVHDIISGVMLNPTLRTGTIPLPLTEAREMTAGDYINAAGNGGILASDTTPTLLKSSGGSRATWATGNTDVLSWQTMAPVDFDPTQDLVINMIASMSNTNDTPTIAVGFIEAMSNTNEGGNTSAVSGTTPTQKSVTIAGNTLTGGNQWNITLTPGAHANDTVRVDAVWIEYQRM